MIGFSPATFDISEPKTVPTLVSFSTIYWIYGSLIVLIVINVKLSLKVFTAPSLVRWPTAGCWGEILNFPATLSPVSRVPGAAPGPECSLWPLNITASKLSRQWVFLRSWKYPKVSNILSSENLNELNFCSSDKILQHLILTTAVRSGQKTQAVCWCPALSSLLQTLERRRGVQHHRSSHPSLASARPVAGSRHCHTQNINILLPSKGVMGLSR